MLTTTPGEKLLIGRRPVRNRIQIHFLFHCENQQKLLPPELHFLAPICTKSFVGWGFAPDPTGGAYSAAQTP